jgi:hypothetical protein
MSRVLTIGDQAVAANRSRVAGLSEVLGLTYHSRTKNNYTELRGSRGLLAFLDSSPRELAHEQTQRVKQQRA